MKFFISMILFSVCAVAHSSDYSPTIYGSASLSDCLNTKDGKLLGCLPVKIKTSFMKSQIKYFPGTTSESACINLLTYRDSYGNTEKGKCMNYHSASGLWVGSTGYWGSIMSDELGVRGTGPKYTANCEINYNTITCKVY